MSRAADEWAQEMVATYPDMAPSDEEDDEEGEDPAHIVAAREYREEQGAGGPVTRC